MEKNIRIGWAQTDITPDRPIYVIGQLYSRISSYVHDPLTATCLVLENGQEQMILVSADMPGVPSMHISRILERLDAPGLDRSRVVFSAIHTHNSTMFTKNTTYEVYFKSVLGDLCPEMEEPDDILKDEELEEFFIGKMVDLIEEAWAARRAGRRGAGARVRGGRVQPPPAVPCERQARVEDVRRLLRAEFPWLRGPVRPFRRHALYL